MKPTEGQAEFHPQSPEINARLQAIMFELHNMGFDAGQLLLTYMEGGNTCGKKVWFGNYYARRGLAEEFLREGQNDDLSEAIAEKSDPPEEGEEWKSN